MIIESLNLSSLAPYIVRDPAGHRWSVACSKRGDQESLRKGLFISAEFQATLLKHPGLARWETTSFSRSAGWSGGSGVVNSARAVAMGEGLPDNIHGLRWRNSAPAKP